MADTNPVTKSEISRIAGEFIEEFYDVGNFDVAYVSYNTIDQASKNPRLVLYDQDLESKLSDWCLEVALNHNSPEKVKEKVAELNLPKVYQNVKVFYSMN